MIELTRAQHLDVIRQLAESSGGRFKFLNNKIPAYRKSEGDWVKMPLSSDVDAFMAEKDLGVPIHDLLTNDDRLGGAAKVKDRRKLHAVFKEYMGTDALHGLEAQQVKNVLIASLKESGAIMPLSDFEDTLHRAVMKSYYPSRIIDSLDMARQVVIWPEHHLRMKTAPLPDEILEDLNTRIVVNDPQRIVDALISGAREHYMRPELFINHVHAEMFKHNIALAIPGEPGMVSELSPGVTGALNDILKVYRHKENGGVDFLKASAPAFEMQYRRLDEDTRKIGRKQHLEMIKAMLTSPSPSATVPENTKQDDFKAVVSERAEMVKKISVRSQLWRWRGIINDVLESSPEMKENTSAFNSKWKTLMSEGATGFDSDLADLESTLSRVETVYGPVVMRQINPMLDDVRLNIRESLGHESQAADYLEQWVYKVQEAAYCDPTAAFSHAQAVCSLVSKEQVELWIEEVNKNPDFIPDVSNLAAEVEVVSHQLHRYSSEPDYSSRGLR